MTLSFTGMRCQGKLGNSSADVQLTAVWDTDHYKIYELVSALRDEDKIHESTRGIGIRRPDLDEI